MLLSRADRDQKLLAAQRESTSFSAANPQTAWYLWPAESSCRGVAGDFESHRLERIGPIGPDTSKWICNSRALAAQQPRCLTYAFGGHSETDWDIAMTRHTGCEHHIFDPTAPCMEPDKGKTSCKPWAEILGPALKANHNVSSYQAYGISGHNGYIKWFRNKIPVYDLSTIMAKLGHTGRRIDVLKLDIEGSEFDVIPNLVQSGIEVGQLLIEVHWPLHREEFSKLPSNQQLAGVHRHFFGLLEEAGFAVAHVEFNIACGFNCVEFLFVNRRLYPSEPPERVATRQAQARVHRAAHVRAISPRPRVADVLSLAPTMRLLAPPEDWLAHMQEINTNARSRHRSRAKLVHYYLNQLAVLLSGAGLHCDMTARASDIMNCLQPFRDGTSGHATFGVTMAGMARMTSMARMVQEVVDHGLNGSYAETGVWRGGMSIFVTAALQMYGLSSRPVYLCDSFRGLPLPRQGSMRASSDAVYHSQNKMLSVGVEMVLENFERYGINASQVVPVEGYFVHSMPKLRASLISRGEKLAILRLDGDMYDSTVDVLYNLYDLVEIGGLVVIDDFGWLPSLSFGARDAILDFRTLHGIEGDTSHAVRNIDGSGAWFRKTREVKLKRDLYGSTLRSDDKVGRQASLRAPGTVRSGAAFKKMLEQWRESWTEDEKRQVDAVTERSVFSAPATAASAPSMASVAAVAKRLGGAPAWMTDASANA